MFEEIHANLYGEVSYLLASAYWGLALSFVYDVIRIVRRVVIHRWQCWIVAEDILFWIYVAWVVFRLAFYMNDGVIRGFSIGGLMIGAYLYHLAARGWLVRCATSALRKIFDYSYIFWEICLKPLKKCAISLKMLWIGVVRSIFCGRRFGKKENDAKDA